MPRMREVGRPARPGPFAAHEWEPRLGSATLGPWSMASSPRGGRGPSITRPREGGVMAERRIAGIDLGIASAHTVVVLTGDGTEVCRRKCVPTAESLGWIERQALQGAP